VQKARPGKPERAVGRKGIYKPGSVVNEHLSGTTVASRLLRPLPENKTGRLLRFLLWPCFRWGLPSRLVSQPLVRSYRTVPSLPVWPCGQT